MTAPEGTPGAIEKTWLDVLELADGTAIRLPVLTAKGMTEGPKMVITAAVHGWEIVGCEVLRRVLREELDLENMRGTLVGVPVANPLAFQVRAYVTPQDGVDVSAAMPGDPKGTPSRRLASRLWKLIENSRCYIDLHCMEGPSVPLTIVRGPESGPVVTEALSIAEAFGLPIARPSAETLKRRPDTGADLAISKGIPSIIPELPFPSIFMNEDSVQIGVRGILNVMKFLKMLSGNVEKQKVEFDLPSPVRTQMIAANHGGIVHPVCKLGTSVKQGDPLVKILDVFGEEVETVLAPREGYVLSFPLNINQIAGSGDFVTLLGYRGD